MKKHSNIILKIFGILFIIFIAYVIYSANKGSFPEFIRRIYGFPGGDKVGHFVLIGLLSFFVNYILHPRQLRIGGKAIFIGTLAVFIFITLEELSQIFIEIRAFDLIDLFCSYLGILAGDQGVRYINKK